MRIATIALILLCCSACGFLIPPPSCLIPRHTETRELKIDPNLTNIQVADTILTAASELDCQVNYVNKEEAIVEMGSYRKFMDKVKSLPPAKGCGTKMKNKYYPQYTEFASVGYRITRVTKSIIQLGVQAASTGSCDDMDVKKFEADHFFSILQSQFESIR